MTGDDAASVTAGREGGQVELSIVIPSRDAAEDLPYQLESLASQHAEVPWEVVVSDNGSTDGTADIALRFAERLDVRVVDASGQPGRAFACNQGAAAARGASICFLDADDEVASGYVDAMAAALRAHPFVAARVDLGLNTGWVASSRDPFQQDGLLDVFGYLPFGIGCTLGVRRDVFEAVGGFSGEIPFDEDVDFCWRVQQAGVPMAFVPDAVVLYRLRDDLWALFRQTVNYGLGQVLLYRRHRHLGMRRRTPQMVRHELSRRVKGVVAIRGRADLARWLHETGYLVGHVWGSIRWRTLYL
ncbi:MAG TPA: glycosyltransferase [Acidimicrobiales bacterium]|nr:glycosyltransferase [Acidimicrobiales bacterium]